ncbi:MAG: lasso peptide isopeptide bond-forming cyclase [Desulforhabdus sp.]|jgi:asparagine synthase (glutamine-hydrolysing)|nr:lasso peptide isopeptide bond-forming cyclase [Desulforhabdus sp.]
MLMSGIFGIFRLDGKHIDQQALAGMLNALAHRGPDGARVWRDKCVGLGHRMLWTTPESLNETLPLENATAKLVITADARIDNREELIEQLYLKASHFEITDSELILKAYEKWGEKCPEKLIGDFAFAIWNERSQKLFCARDHANLKPFYYYHDDRFFAFASEIKALLYLNEIPRQLNDLKVADYLMGNFENRTDTFYKKIQRLPEANSLSVSRKGISKRTYWSLDPSRELRFSRDEDYVDAFRNLFEETIRCRLRSSFPVGCFLSGGLDSSSITCSASRILSGNQKTPHLHTFSAVFPSIAQIDARIDERLYIDCVVSRYKAQIEPHFIHLDQMSPLLDLHQVMWHLDAPNPAFNFYLDWAICKAAQQENVRILLSGYDGDTTVSYGYEYLAYLASRLKWGKLIKEAIAHSKKIDASAVTTIWKYGFSPLFPDFVQEMITKVTRRRRRSFDRRNTLNLNFAKKMTVNKGAQNNGKSGKLISAREEHRMSLMSGMLLEGPEHFDKAAAAFSLEMRLPFFDRRLLEFCLALPLSHRFRDGWNRAILRRAMQGTLPSDVLERLSKGNLSANFKLKLLDNEKELLEKIIMKEPALIEKYMDLASLRASFERYMSKPLGTTQEAVTVFLAANLFAWLSSFFAR